MGSSRVKTRHVAQISVQQFLRVHPNAYYWTFTIHENCTDKLEAMRLAKPLFDLIGRRTQLLCYARKTTHERGSYLAFWELQKRGCWHLHLLTGVFFDVNWLRPWMVQRGWGPIMRAERVQVDRAESGVRLGRYLTKYLTKSLDDCPRKKAFTASAAAKVGSIGFSWTAETDPHAYFFYWGRQLFFELYHHAPKFHQFREVMRLGYEATEWASRDPWSDPPG